MSGSRWRRTNSIAHGDYERTVAFVKRDDSRTPTVSTDTSFYQGIARFV